MYAAPHNAPNMLVLDTATDAVYGVSTEHIQTGNNMWVGVTAVGHAVYAGPWNALGVLVAAVPVPSGCASIDASELNSEACTSRRASHLE